LTELQKDPMRESDRSGQVSILIVDDEENDRRALRLLLASLELSSEVRVDMAASIEEGLSTLAQNRAAVLFLDKNLGPDESNIDQNGIESIPRFLSLQPHLKIVMVTGSDGYADATRAMQLGAFDFISKKEPKELLEAKVKKAIQYAHQDFDMELLRSRHREDDDGPGSVLGGNSPAWTRALERARLFALSDHAILFMGPTGSGKTTLAQFIHSCRKEKLKGVKELIHLNMATVSETMAERDLFGSEAGAYTDARRPTSGFFYLAHEGTLFLDEIGEASLDIQKKLLTVLDKGVFYRLGGEKPITSRFKLICATNQNLEEMVQAKTFRADLYNRLATLVMEVPSIDERREDIPDILRVILPKEAKKSKVQVAMHELPEDLIQYLVEMPHPGGIRTLEQQFARLFTVADKDRAGRLIFSNWKDKLFPKAKRAAPTKKLNALSLKDLTEIPTDLITPDFPGIKPTVEILVHRIYQEAREKYGNSLETIASTLKVSRATANRGLRQVKTNDKTSKNSNSSN
jgi:DNA-binding NtrC family response regulator